MSRIIEVYPHVLDVLTIDEDESESVAIHLVEVILAETNIYYRQHVFAKRVIQLTAKNMVDSVFDLLHAATLIPDESMHKLFLPEKNPMPNFKDRHAVRSLPCKSHHERASTHAISSSASQTDQVCLTVSKGRRRRKLEKEKNTIVVEEEPIVFTLPEEEDEQPDIKNWRDDFLKELNSSKQKLLPSHSDEGSRRIALVEPKISNAIEMIDSSTRQENVFSVKTKFNIDSFTQIVEPEQRQRKKVYENIPSSATASKSTRISSIAPSSANPGSRVKNILLREQLEKKKPSSAAPTRSQWTFSSGSINLFTPEFTEFNPGMVTKRIDLTAGVAMLHGKTKKEGPERSENINSMSKKRFDLHSRLGGASIWQENPLHLTSRAVSPTLSVGHDTLVESFGYELKSSPSGERLQTKTLVLPRSHLLPSLSTPSLRVRTSPCKLNQIEAVSSLTNSETMYKLEEVQPKKRPSTAVASITTPLGTAIEAASVHKYLRDFPKPKPGVIKVIHPGTSSTGNIA